MADVYCYSGATGAANGSSWTDAYTTLQAAITAAGAGGKVYWASDNAEDFGASTTITLPADSDLPVVIVSTDRTTNEYAKAASAQIDSSTSAADLTFDGNAIFFGCYLDSADLITFLVIAEEFQRYYDCTINQADRRRLYSSGIDGTIEFYSTTFIGNDASSTNEPVITLTNENSLLLSNCSFSGTYTRTGPAIKLGDNTTLVVTGTDFTGIGSGLSSIIERDANTLNWITLDGCKLPAVSLFNTAVKSDLRGSLATRCDNNNFGVLHDGYWGSTVDSATVYRTGGASDGTAFSWLVTTGANCKLGTEYATPWINVWVADTGSTTFDVYIANNSADLTDTQCWLEVEYFETSGSTKTSIATDRAANIIGAGVDTGRDDTTSTWNGATLGYPQKLSVTANIGKAGMCRARVVFAAASKTVYVDPLVTVTAA